LGKARPFPNFNGKMFAWCSFQKERVSVMQVKKRSIICKDNARWQHFSSSIASTFYHFPGTTKENKTCQLLHEIDNAILLVPKLSSGENALM
jgi:hypothetical protein